MRTKLLLSLALLLLAFNAIKAQNEYSKWYFGINAALDFSTTPPTPIATSAMATRESCSSISDAAGNLLFYTDGMSVWDRTNAVMANGSGLDGNWSSSQSGLIVKQPGNANLYYIFTLDELALTKGLKYSVVDMSLAAGMGSVTVKNVPLVTPTTEKLAAVKHCNGTDVWVMSHDWNSSVFRAYLLSASGLSATAVTSTIGPVYAPGPYNERSAAQGQMKFSPTGKKLGIVSYNVINTAAVYDFNNATGVVSNPVILTGALSNSVNSGYGCEFSPDGTRFYADQINSTISNNSNASSVIYQWDLCAGTPSAMAASQYSIGSLVGVSNPGNWTYGMQLAIDGKLYISTTDTFLNVINNPNALGAACSYSLRGQILKPGGAAYIGLPNYVASVFRPALPPFSYTNTCQTVAFNASFPPCEAAGFDYLSATWLFGDGNNSTGTGFSTSHFYAAGTYTVRCVLSRACGSDTLTQFITVPSQTPVLAVSGNSVLCLGITPSTSLSVSATANTTYSWSTGSSNTTISVSPTVTTTYTVTGTNTVTGCSNKTTYTVSVSKCTGIDKYSVAAGVSVYPNPASEQVTITLRDNSQVTGPIEVMITDLLGQVIKQQSLTSENSKDYVVSLKDMSDGIYVINVKNSNRLLYTGKLQKQGQ